MAKSAHKADFAPRRARCGAPVFPAYDSVKIYIYFLDLKKDNEYIKTPYTMEQIYNNDTENFIRLYGTSNFHCTNIDYHEKTGNVKSLTFEQQIY